MDKVFRSFYRNLYMRTGGYIPAAPLYRYLLPGDFFQVKNGAVIVLGNIFRNNLTDRGDVEINTGIRLDPYCWNFSDGVSKVYSGRGTGEGPLGGDFQYSKQVLLFNTNGSFHFAGHNPEAIRLMNWSDIRDQLLIRMTQTMYSFREVYVVTESASLSHWSLAVAGAAQAELEIASETESAELVDIFGHQAARTIQSKDIEYYHRQQKREHSFFKAKKLTVQEEKKQVFISELVVQSRNRDEWYNEFFDVGYDYVNQHGQLETGARESVLDMLQANQLNPNNALSYFKWTDADLDDIEKLFLTYDNIQKL